MLEEEILGKAGKSEEHPGCLNFDIALELGAPTAPSIKLISNLFFSEMTLIDL